MRCWPQHAQAWQCLTLRLLPSSSQACCSPVAGWPAKALQNGLQTAAEEASIRIQHCCQTLMWLGVAGDRLWAANGQGKIQALDMRQRAMQAAVKGSAGSIRALSLHEDSGLLASAGLDRYTVCLQGHSASPRCRRLRECSAGAHPCLGRYKLCCAPGFLVCTQHQQTRISRVHIVAPDASCSQLPRDWAHVAACA